MKYKKFMKVPVELQIQIIRKCYPTPYVRLRQSCRFIDEFCQRNRRLLGIFYGSEPHLHVTYYLSSPDLFSRLREIHRPIKICYLLVNSNKSKCDFDFKAALTERNFPKISDSLFGFTFIHATVEDEFGKLCEVMPLFLKLAVDFKVKHLTLNCVETKHAERLTNLMTAFLEWKQPDERNILANIKGRKYFHLCGKLSVTNVWRLLKDITKNWKSTTDEVPDKMWFKFKEDDNYPDLNLVEAYTTVLPQETVHLGQVKWYMRQRSQIPDFMMRINDLYDIWIIKTAGTEHHWRIITVRRKAFYQTVIKTRFRNLKRVIRKFRRIFEFI